jgi:DNA-binding NtrC family response regulator
MKILVVDDEQIALTSIRRLLKLRGYRDIILCNTGEEAIIRLTEEDFDVVLLDIILGDVDGMTVLEKTKPLNPGTEFILITAIDDVTTAVKAVRLGAFDYLVKPVNNDKLLLSIERAFERKGLRTWVASAGDNSKKLDIPAAFADSKTTNTRLQELLIYANSISQADISVLITGESGTGKELLAKGIHRASLRAAGPFVAVNVSAVPDTLFESQFFGFYKGAFTGADKSHAGFLEQAQGGTLFLDEIGELPLHLQVKLLRVLEEKVVDKLGGTQPIKLDFRLISATNKDLKRSCQEGTFRTDLLYRLSTVQVSMPPLRQRTGDIAYLAEYFFQETNKKHKKDIKGIGHEALTALASNHFPGNIRELMSIIEKAVLVTKGPLIVAQDLGLEERPPSLASRSLCSVKENDDIHFVYVITQFNGDRKQTAATLGVSVRHVQRKLKELKENPQWHHLLSGI